MRPPDIFPLGIAGELLAARLTGGPSLDDDVRQLADLEGHLITYTEHIRGFQAARARGDPYNMLVEVSDALINAFFGWIVASRIGDALTRTTAFDRLDQATGGAPRLPMGLKPGTPQVLVEAYLRMVVGLGREPVGVDIEAITQAIVGLIAEEPWMDVNVDGAVNVLDAILAAQVVDALATTTEPLGTLVF